MKAVLYTRVSTDEQKENGFSLQDQEVRLRRYCQQNNIEVISHYQDDHSAKNFNRPQFQRFVDDVVAKKINPDMFLCVRADRFSRDVYGSLAMLQRFKAWNIQFRTLENHIELDTPEALLPFVINFTLGQVDNERRGLNTKRGMRQAVREGRWPWRAPIGYRNNPLTKEIDVDEKIGPLVKEAFETFAKGIYTAEEVRLAARKKGLICSKSNFLDTLRNTFYAGRIVLAAWKDEKEEFFIGKHFPLVSEQTFKQVQDILKGKRKAISISNTRCDELLLRGFLQCKECGHKLTGSGSRSRNGSIHYYYHCQHGCKERFRADEANRDFALFLDRMALPEEVMNLYYAILKDVFGTDNAKRESETKRLTGQIELANRRLSSLEDKYVDDDIDRVTYQRKKGQYEEEKAGIKAQLTFLENQDDSFNRYLKYGCTLLGSPGKYYNESPLEVKQKIIGSIFPGKLIYEDKNYRTTELNYFVELITSKSDINEDNKQEKVTQSGDLSCLVPGAGLEPACPCRHWCLRPTRLPIPPSRHYYGASLSERGCKSKNLARFCKSYGLKNRLFSQK